MVWGGGVAGVARFIKQRLPLRTYGLHFISQGEICFPGIFHELWKDPGVRANRVVGVGWGRGGGVSSTVDHV